MKFKMTEEDWADFEHLYSEAIKVVNPRKLSRLADAGGVGAAIRTIRGNVYTGVCIDTACSLGFCAEHAAASAMITAGENEIEKVLAVNGDGEVLSPCGRCREFLLQIGEKNGDALVKVNNGEVLQLKELLPYSRME